MKSLRWWLLGAAAFTVVATANGAGYRYGVSDQAFYIPVVVRALVPEAFPRDAALIDAQGHLMLADEILAALVRTTGLALPVLFLGGYVLSMTLLWAGVALVGLRLTGSPLVVAALGAAITLRHRIARTSANSLEPYFHPRMLAFGLGVLAVAALLRRRFWLCIALTAASAVVHVTTALWFAVLLGVALAVLDRRFRTLALVVAAAGAVAASWSMTAGPLRSWFTPMDDVWLRAVASKDSLFASEWPLWAWLTNLGTLGALWWAHLRRRADGDSRPEEAALVWGATALVALFLLTLPLVTAGVGLLVQLQIPRVFWLVDFLAVTYVVAALCTGRHGQRRLATGVAALLILFAVGRGAYSMLVERPDRPLFAVGLAQSPWEDAMRWLARQPRSAHVLADPGHAWKYGTSVRVSAERDVFLEEVKDSAIAIYARDVAARVVERTEALGDFQQLAPARARELAARYDLHYLVSDRELPLPIAYRNDQFRIYELGER